MSKPDSQTTPEAVIRRAVVSVCSDGNSDASRVARDVIGALYAAGYQILPAIVIADADAGRRFGGGTTV